MDIKPGLFAIAAAATIAVLSGCGTSTDTSGPAVASTTSATSPSSTATAIPASPSKAAGASPSAAMAVLITIKDFKFTVPASVAPGSKVTVKNEDSENHTVTSATHGAFAVQANAGTTVSFTAPAKPGSYPFACTFHPSMMGTLVVK